MNLLRRVWSQFGWLDDAAMRGRPGFPSWSTGSDAGAGTPRAAAALILGAIGEDAFALAGSGAIREHGVIHRPAPTGHHPASRSERGHPRGHQDSGRPSIAVTTGVRYPR